MKTVNALGKVCPAPVIMAKKALKEEPGIIVLVDNETACENLGKLAEQNKLDIDVKKENINKFSVTLKKTDEKSEEESEDKFVKKSDSYDVVINSNVMGSGSDELGDALLHGFVYSLTEQDVLPDKVILYNGGAKLMAKDSDYLTDLQTLSDKGVKILTCGTCLNFFEIDKDSIIGEVTNMFSIVEMMRKSNRLVKPF